MTKIDTDDKVDVIISDSHGDDVVDDDIDLDMDDKGNECHLQL